MYFRLELRTFGDKLIQELSGKPHFIWTGKIEDQKPLSRVGVESVGVNHYPTLGRAIAKITFSALNKSPLCNGNKPFVFLELETSKDGVEVKAQSGIESKIDRIKELAINLVLEVLEGFKEPLFKEFDIGKVLNAIRISQRNDIDLEIHASLISSSPDEMSYNIVEVKHIKKVSQYHGSCEYKLNFFKKDSQLYMSVIGNSNIDQRNIKKIGGIIRDKLEAAQLLVGDTEEISQVFDIGVEKVYMLGLIL